MTTLIGQYTGSRAIIINDYNEAYNLAKMIAKTDFAPKNYRGKPEDITIAMLFGMEVGLPPIASLQNIAVVNGQPTLWGDGMLSLVENSGLMEDYISSYEGVPYEDNYRAIVTIKRKYRKTLIVSEFSVGDAKRARLWDQKDNWKYYPKRMLLNRARTYALRNGFPDILKGFKSREEMEDSTDMKNVTNIIDENVDGVSNTIPEFAIETEELSQEVIDNFNSCISTDEYMVEKNFNNYNGGEKEEQKILDF